MASLSPRTAVWAALEDPERGPGRWLAGFLITLILANVAAMIVGSIVEIQATFGRALWMFEAASVAVFTIEYLARLWSSAEAGSRLRYFVTPMAIIDLAAILPFYLGSLIGIDLRVLRLLRLLRLLKLSRYFAPLQVLGTVLRAEARPMAAAAGVMIALITVSASLLYYAERAAQPDAFGDIPRAMWWAAVTLTTVGYGDVAPVTPLGQAIAVLVMAMGVGMVALPAGMLASRFSEELKVRRQAFARAISDNRHDADQLGRLQEQLCLSPTDADRLRTNMHSCPHCGSALNQPMN